MGIVTNHGIVVTDGARYTCTVNVSDETYDKLATFAHREKMTLQDALDVVLGDELDWKEAVDEQRVPPTQNLGRPPAQHLWFACSCCAPDRCKHPFYWRGTMRCACTKTSP